MRTIGGLIVAALVVLVGCGSQSAASTTPGVTVDCSTFEAAGATPVTEQLAVPVGSDFTVTLCSNPSTGFSWEEPTWDGDAGIELSNSTTAQGVGGMPGAASEQVFTFTTTDLGTSQIEFLYSQPWEGGTTAAWTLDLQVTVE